MSGSYDKTVKVWDLKTGECRLTMRGHTAAVLCVQFDEQKIVSGSYDKKIKVRITSMKVLKIWIKCRNEFFSRFGIYTKGLV